MVKRYEFIERINYLIREKLSKNLPEESTLDEMVNKAKQLIREIFE